MVLNAKEITYTWIPVLHGAVHAHVGMQIQTTVGLHEGVLHKRLCRWECACNGSQQQTHYWLHAFTHTHICYVGVVVRSCPWWYYLSSTTPVPTVHWCETTSSTGGGAAGGGGGGDIRCGAVRAKALLNTYVDGTNTGVRERSPVQSHVALHHIHQHSALSSRALGPSLQTALARAKHQSASQSAQVKEANVS